jgi:hypothetical protein
MRSGMGLPTTRRVHHPKYDEQQEVEEEEGQ